MECPLIKLTWLIIETRNFADNNLSSIPFQFAFLVTGKIHIWAEKEQQNLC